MISKSQSVINYRKRKKLELIYQSGGKCQLCGYNKCENALEFHHLYSEEKESSISTLLAQGKYKEVLEEVKKCILVCSNCHKEIHHKNYNHELKVNDGRKEILIDGILVNISWEEKECEYCKKIYYTIRKDQKFCSIKCYTLSQYKVKNRPSKEELQTLITEFSWTEIGRKYNVSDNAVRKWAKKYELI